MKSVFTSANFPSVWLHEAWESGALLDLARSKYIIILLHSHTVFRYTASLFCKTATAFNPFIYFFMVESFRHDFVEVIGKLCLGGEGAGFAAASNAKSKTHSYVR